MTTKPASMSDILERLERIESQLAVLIKALSDDGEGDDKLTLTLDGFDVGRERDANQPL